MNAIDDNVEFEKWWMSTPILRKQKIQIAQEAWFARAKLGDQAAPDLLAALQLALDALAHCAADKGYQSLQNKAAQEANRAIARATQ